MSWRYLAGREAESSEESHAVTLASGLVKLRNTHGKFFWLGRETGCCQNSQSGTTSKHSEATTLNAPNISTSLDQSKTNSSSAEDSHAKILVAQIQTQSESKEKEAVFGEKCYELSVKYDQQRCSLRTLHGLFQEDLHWSQVDLPSWGMTVDGAFLGVTTPEAIAKANGVGLWPRPCKSEGTGGMAQTGSVAALRRIVDNGQIEYEEALKISRGQIHKKNLKHWRIEEHEAYLKKNGKKYSGESFGTLHPSLYEWVMTWPIGWTDLQPLEMDKIHEWLSLHGIYLTDK